MKVSKTLTRKTACVTAALVFLWIGVSGAKGADEHVGRDGYIDTHNHLFPDGGPPCVFDAAADAAVAIMDEAGIATTLLMPAPQPKSGCGPAAFAAIVARHPGRFEFLHGGANLNPIIQTAVRTGEVTPDMREQFERTALGILRQGAIGFGELASEHFSFSESFISTHPYETAPPNHELFLLLADLAARYDVPIDLHMEAIAFHMLFKDISECSKATRGWPNPDQLVENISAFERFLAYNHGARVVWAHAGWDNTGHRTVALMRRLMEDHPNLYLQIRPYGTPSRCAQGLPNRVFLTRTSLDPEWSQLIRDFPDRFVVGLDTFFEELPGQQHSRGEFFLSLLDPDLAMKVGMKNAVRIYNLDRPLICHRRGTPAEQTLRVDASALESHLAHGDTLGPCG